MYTHLCVIQIERRFVAMVNRARIEFSRSRTACNRGRLESMPEVQRVIDENLDAVERVWHGSGFAIDSLVGFALMKWLWNQQLVRPRYPVSMNAYALPRCSFTTINIRATRPPFFHTPVPDLNLIDTGPFPIPTFTPILPLVSSHLFLHPFSLFARARASTRRTLRANIQFFFI